MLPFVAFGLGLVNNYGWERIQDEESDSYDEGFKTLTLLYLNILVVEILLIIGGIELNPGPTDHTKLQIEKLKIILKKIEKILEKMKEDRNVTRELREIKSQLLYVLDVLQSYSKYMEKLQAYRNEEECEPAWKMVYDLSFFKDMLMDIGQDQDLIQRKIRRLNLGNTLLDRRITYLESEQAGHNNWRKATINDMPMITGRRKEEDKEEEEQSDD